MAIPRKTTGRVSQGMLGLLICPSPFTSTLINTPISTMQFRRIVACGGRSQIRVACNFPLLRAIVPQGNPRSH